LWWRTPVISKVKRMRQEDQEFEASLGYTFGGRNDPNIVCTYE
jgi:hypothetical protein